MRNRLRLSLSTLVGALVLVGCSTGSREMGAPRASTPGAAATDSASGGIEALDLSPAQTQPASDRPPANPLRNAYFGDLHVHTRDSFDAYLFNTRTSPDEAYHYARGGALKHPSGFEMRLAGGALDFLAVTDHAEFLGTGQEIDTPGTPLSRFRADMTANTPGGVGAAFGHFVRLEGTGVFTDRERIRSTWAKQVAAAQRADDPGRFTAFIGYEYTASAQGRNLHRNLIFHGAKVPAAPYSAADSNNPEELWRWMDRLRLQGIESLAIPHNSNGSDGIMFPRTQSSGSAIDRRYAELRARNEPLVEVTQVKGTSETHPLLSPHDELAGFEIIETYIGTPRKITQFDGGYARKALRDGLEIGAAVGANPYRFGLIGSSDTHNGAPSFDERALTGHHGILDGFTDRRAGRPDFGTGGLVGVWAQENTRESLFNAMRRRETFATTGTRIRVRFFAGHAYDRADLASEVGLRQAYAQGVPMGGELRAEKGRSPVFLVSALRDVRGAPLQRLQIVKGWVDAQGKSHESVRDIACADGAAVNARTQRCPDNGASVDLRSCALSSDKGAAELAVRWRDPEFDPARPAFYYVRVIENPSCRWTTWDAIRRGVAPPAQVPATLQERAYTSPIWINPAAGG
jgi:hypothetical protein